MEPDGYCLTCGCVTTSAADLFNAPSQFYTETPSRIGEYEIIEEIARGGMGIVYKARQGRLNRTVALKVLLGGIISHPAQVQRFNAEAQIVAALNHPNIISVHEIGEERGACYFSMPLVNGLDLAKLGRVQPEKAARYVQKIAEAVYHAHQRGVLHRDLKPNNVLIDEQDEPRVVDFGIAKLTAETHTITQTGESLGTPSYMAPEQVHPDASSVSVATDIYALGGILYFLLTGRPPFNGPSRDQTLWSVFYDEPKRPSESDPLVPRDLETICLKCLSKDPADRYATCGDLAEDLRRFLADEPIRARPISVARRTVLWSRRNPALAACAAALVAALCYGVIAQQLALRQARKARADAETLIGFMDKEITDKLRPLGRLEDTATVVREAEAYFSRQSEADSGPDFLLRKASYFWRAGNLQRDLGKLTEADRLAREGLATLDRFQSKRQSDAESWTLRARLELLVFQIDKAFGKKAEADEFATRALANQRRAAEVAPEDSIQSAVLSEMLMETGRFYRDERRSETADTQLEEASERLSAISARNPNDLTVRRLLAQTHYDRGIAQQNAHDNASALQEFKLYIRALEEIKPAAESDRDWQYELATAYGRAADAYYSLGSRELCEKLVENWTSATEKLVAIDPKNILWRASLAQSLAWAGMVTRDKAGAETDPRVGKLFQRALNEYLQLSVQVPYGLQHVEGSEEISGNWVAEKIQYTTDNLVRYYLASHQPDEAERLLISNVGHHFDLAVRSPGAFAAQRALANAFDKQREFLENQQRRPEFASWCQTWLGQLRTRFADSPAPYLWQFTEARVNSYLANLATRAERYDQSVTHWRRALELLRGISNSAAGKLNEEFSYAYRSLVSVQSKRGNVADFISASSEALDWVMGSPAKPASVIEDVCVGIAEKAAALDVHDPAIEKVLSRCREQLLAAPQSLTKFDDKVKDQKLTSAR